MRQLGERVGRLLHGGDLIMLNGPLGAGKTTLTQGIARGMGVGARVVSPTFVIAQVHHSAGGGPDLVHVDAYRLNSLEELDALDLDASLEESVTVVEWGEGKVEVLSPDRLMISIARAVGGDPLEVDTPRTVGFEASGPRSHQLLAQLSGARPGERMSRDAVPMSAGGEQAQEASWFGC
ncbi:MULTISPECIES: tRNA (adenosine(37)-N6)-threonylcarbamoyltransferase complex ATPase subunit type 1 TsaE [unclassified Actinobaculum]|uniref:tRNA (adenosine(37)-N6)-threonylcarbamoyltransferase complex ATPase subunit type 1 TsaE n=1 Tax=unclassified Actinobaculum TaxID=2609299 RepID=UPI000D52A3DE|nr:MULTISPECIES: tRNA (adenosine(37)-N6)-threonylcarbamoyltransferase complex ATPase subunit type 1 TsaE [unclassified Actinobaculum]AWE43407.1 tRNA (adenosine(37)-N6)-threonylcarbamoyltransferase complex ATPase subunit type 1 TsaE [Actinobaculum sp. 313]RTE50955.1 tRNA (adenosine(37)-N6)-threonylcarbamoyltransferase complex ATPase subunit type 1 TsaE [Actinobaculum sp. 352]